MRIAAWRITPEGPVRTVPTSVRLERDLEGWIERDPSLVMEGLRIVGRQVPLEAGRLDLLAVDPAGRLHVIEVKAGTLHREVVAQGLDYSAALSVLPSDQLRDLVAAYLGRVQAPDVSEVLDNFTTNTGDPREVNVVVVGTGRDPGLDRLAGFLADRYSVPMKTVTFEVLDDGRGEPLLVREVTETPIVAPAREDTARGNGAMTPGDILAIAERRGIGPAMRRLHDTSVALGFYPRAYRRCIMFTPPTNRNRMLFVTYPRTGARGFWAGVDEYAEFYPVDVAQARAALGEPGWRPLTDEAVGQYTTALTQLLSHD